MQNMELPLTDRWLYILGRKIKGTQAFVYIDVFCRTHETEVIIMTNYEIIMIMLTIVSIMLVVVKIIVDLFLKIIEGGKNAKK